MGPRFDLSFPRRGEPFRRGLTVDRLRRRSLDFSRAARLSRWLRFPVFFFREALLRLELAELGEARRRRDLLFTFLRDEEDEEDFEDSDDALEVGDRLRGRRP